MKVKQRLVLSVVSLGGQKNSRGLQDNAIKPGENLIFHYYPQINENLSVNYASVIMSSNNSLSIPNQRSTGPNPRKIELKNILFNDHGDPDINNRKSTFDNNPGKRTGMMNTNDSIKFLRGLASTPFGFIQTKKRKITQPLPPPTLQLLNYTIEPIICVIRNLNIKPEIIELENRGRVNIEDVNSEIFLPTINENNRILRARVSISLIETTLLR